MSAPSPLFPNAKNAKASAAALSETEGETFFRGVISRITFHNTDTGFGVVRVEPEQSSASDSTLEIATVIGVLPADVSTGSMIIARGEWQSHPKFGKQFRARSIIESQPTSREAIQRYLGSGAVKGFGPVLAERIVEVFGESSLAVLDNEPERLLEVQGIGEKKLGEIRAAWDQKKNLREVLLFFQNHNIPTGLAQRIYNTYGVKAIERVSENPYVLARDVWGVGFKTADQIASALGIQPTSKERLVAGISYSLRRASEDGHCFLPAELLLAKAGSLLGVEDEDTLREGLKQAIHQEEVLEEGSHIYLPPLLLAERNLAEYLAERLRGTKELAGHIPQVLLDRYSGSNQHLENPQSPELLITLSEQQREAVRLAATRSMVVITGGPGCGKTTVTRTIAAMYRAAGLRLALAAPTGRAAQRLSEVCDLKASTIHRLLKFDPMRRSFVHNRETLLAIDALIIDESSMIDINLAVSLFAAISPETRVVVVGDADQLPSVGPGLFLADLLSIQEVARVRLTQLFRRSDESRITEIAHEINSASVPEIPEPDGNTKSDAYFLKAEDPKDAATLIERLVIDQIPKRFGFRGQQITVLSPMNQGELGVISLNERLQKLMVPAQEGMPQVTVGNLQFRLGDRVCQRANNYQLHPNGVFNGDQGEVVGIDAEAKSLTVKLWDGREVVYQSDSMYQLDLAYAITIHRSQGSEVPVVILALHDSHNILLERQLIYTAVTRAKKLLIIVGTRRALAIATKRSRSKRRYTALGERTSELLR